MYGPMSVWTEVLQERCVLHLLAGTVHNHASPETCFRVHSVHRYRLHVHTLYVVGDRLAELCRGHTPQGAGGLLVPTLTMAIRLFLPRPKGVATVPARTRNPQRQSAVHRLALWGYPSKHAVGGVLVPPAARTVLDSSAFGGPHRPPELSSTLEVVTTNM